MTNKNKNLLPTATAAVNALCNGLDETFELPSGGAELLVFELLAHALVQADPKVAVDYLNTLAEQLLLGDDFSEDTMGSVRAAMMSAIAISV